MNCPKYEEILVDAGFSAYPLRFHTFHRVFNESYDEDVKCRGFSCRYSISDDGKYIILTKAICSLSEKFFDKKMGAELCLHRFQDLPQYGMILSNDLLLYTGNLFKFFSERRLKQGLVTIPTWLDLSLFYRNYFLTGLICPGFGIGNIKFNPRKVFDVKVDLFGFSGITQRTIRFEEFDFHMPHSNHYPWWIG